MQTDDLKNAAQMGEENILKLLYRFSLPATVGMLVMATYNVVDTIFVGRLGSEAIAALSIAFPIQMLLSAVAIGTGVGAGSLIARSLGAGDKAEAERAAGQVISMALIFGMVTALLGLLYLRPLLLLLGAMPEVLALTAEYMIVITTGSVMLFLLMIMNHIVRAEGNPILSMKIMIISGLLNIALDPVFIFLLGMGVQGAAVATIVSKIAAVIIMLHYFFMGESVLRLTPSCLRLRWRTLINIYRVGFPAMLLQLSMNISLIITNNILAAFGHVPIAVMGLIFRLQMFAIMPVLGVSQGLLPIIGFNFGAGKKERMREALLKGMGIGVAFISVTGAALFLAPVFFMGLFSSEKELLSLGSYALRITVAMFPLVGVKIVSSVFFQAIGKGIPSLFLTLLREIILFIPLLLILSGYLGLTGIWLARPLSDLLTFLVILLFLSRELKLQGIPLWGPRQTLQLNANS